ncbi:hypothetical protein C8J56DRAFT_946470 [Mycena floridula]|nr:hypothetical protein C8J56DRAFT_946470 [Mycena floridula]
MRFSKSALVAAMIVCAAAAPYDTTLMERDVDVNLGGRGIKTLVPSSTAPLQINVVGTKSVCITEFSKKAALKKWTGLLKKKYTKCEITVHPDDSGGRLNFYNGDKGTGVIMNYELFKPLSCPV